MNQQRQLLDERQNCPMDKALKTLAGKWKPKILHMLLDEALHFGAISRNLPAASRKVLAAQLRQLVNVGLLERRQLSDARQHVIYGLAESGRNLSPILQQLYAWGQSLPSESDKHTAPAE